MKQEIKQTAYHEAGHYVAKRAMLAKYGNDADAWGDEISIVSNVENGTLGHVIPLDEDLETAEGTRAYIVSLYAGAATDRHMGEDEELILVGACSDYEEAEKHIEFVPETAEELQQAAQELIEEHFEVIERIALDLLRFKFLEATECDFLYEGDMESLGIFRRNFGDRLNQLPGRE